MELCHKLPNTNVDDVTNALKLANRRLISGYYMDGEWEMEEVVTLEIISQ